MKLKYQNLILHLFSPCAFYKGCPVMMTPIARKTETTNSPLASTRPQLFPFPSLRFPEKFQSLTCTASIVWLLKGGVQASLLRVSSLLPGWLQKHDFLYTLEETLWSLLIKWTCFPLTLFSVVATNHMHLCKEKFKSIKETHLNPLKHTNAWPIVVVWTRMDLLGSCVWVLGPQLIKLFGKY